MSYLNRYLKRGKKDFAAISFLAGIDHIQSTSKEVADSILKELKDQRSFLKLIASENYCSLAVQLAMGNLLTDKYSEGIPHKRFYAGCDNVDDIESLAEKEAKKIFNADHAYVQPHSGADANMLAYWAIIVHKVEDAEIEKLGKKNIDELTEKEYERIRQLLVNQKVMGMGLNSGGHLTHGYKRNMSAKMMRSVSYEVGCDGLIDYSKLREMAKREKPLILVAGYSAYPRLINFAKMKEIAEEVGAVFMVDMAHFAGLVAGKVMQGEYDPVKYADVVTSTTHKTLRGPRGGLILCKEEFKDSINKGCPLVLGGPMPHVMAAKAVAFKEAGKKSFCEYAEKIVENAKVVAETLKSLGAKVITGGTDNHLLLVDVTTSFGITGRHAENVLREARITLNRNTIPNDVNGPWYTSGIRLGTPAVTSLNMGKDEMKIIGRVIYNVLKSSKAKVLKDGKVSKVQVDIDENILRGEREKIEEVLEGFPLYPEIEID